MIYLIPFLVLVVIAALTPEQYEPRRWPEIWSRFKRTL